MRLSAWFDTRDLVFFPYFDFRVSYFVISTYLFPPFSFFLLLLLLLLLFKVVTKNKEIFSLSEMFFPGEDDPSGRDPSEKLRREQKREMEERRRHRGGRAMSTSTTTTTATSSSKEDHHFHREKSRRRRRRRDDDALFSVLWKADLICRVEDVAAKRGIRTRRNDKIQVPASALRTLEMRQMRGSPVFLRQKRCLFVED